MKEREDKEFNRKGEGGGGQGILPMSLLIGASPSWI